MEGYDAMILSAHPDDAEFAMGGTLLLMAEKFKVVHVILTKGEAGTHGTPEQREAEARQAAEYANIKAEFLGFRDNHVEDNAESCKRIAEEIRKHRPKIIFAPYHTHRSTHEDGLAHPDHEALGKIAVKAARFARFKNAGISGEPHKAKTIIYYMVPLHSRPSIIIDVTGKLEQMKELWGFHESQMKLRDGKISELLLAHRKHAGYQNGCEYAEAFIIDRPLRQQITDIFSI